MKTLTRRKERSLPVSFGTGLAAAVISETALLALLAALTSAGVIAERAMETAAVVCALLSSFAGAFIGALRTPKLSLPLAAGIGAAALGLNLLLGALLPGEGSLSAAMISAFLAGAIAAGVVAAMRKGRK